MNAVLWAVLTACVWGIVPVLEKLGLVKADPFTGLFYRCMGVIVGIMILGAFMVRPEQLKAVGTRSVLLLILSGFLASFVAQITFYHALKIGDVSRVVPISGTYPLIAFILGVLVLGESVTFAKVIGMLMVVAGVWFLR